MKITPGELWKTLNGNYVIIISENDHERLLKVVRVFHCTIQVGKIGYVMKNQLWGNKFP